MVIPVLLHLVILDMALVVVVVDLGVVPVQVMEVWVETEVKQLLQYMDLSKNPSI
jgi:hypothetical protein